MASPFVLDDIKHVSKRAGHEGLLVSIDPQFQLPNARTSEGGYVTGLAAIGRYLSDCSGPGLNRTEKAVELQWMEYRTKRIDQCGHSDRDRRQLLGDVNGHLERRTFLMGATLGVVDYVIYLGLAPILNETSLLEREAYPHLGRWFQLVRGKWGAKEKQRPSGTEWRQILFSKTPL